MNRLCDLHTHSTFSDGTYTPEEIIDKSIEIGLSAVALCDHNTVDGIPNFLTAATNKDIEAVPGAEFSVDYNGVELHLLGLFMPAEYLGQITQLMSEVNARKEKSNIDLIDALRKDGIILDYEKIKAETPTGKVNRAHIAAALTQEGYTHSIKEAFSSLLSKDAGYYNEPKRLTVWEMIDFILDIKAVPVLAHPFLNLSFEQLATFLPLAKKRGLIGMECQYSLYDKSTTQTALELAKRFELKPSGGSDFHGEIKQDINLGVGKGQLQIPYEWFLNLKHN